MKIYLDDERSPPDDTWVRVTTPDSCIDLLTHNQVSEVSFDHDLGGDESIGTGYDVMKWIEDNAHIHGILPPTVHIHTANPVARQRMEGCKRSIEMAARIIKRKGNE